MREKFLTVEDVAERLNTSVASVRWMIRTGRAPKSAKFGRRRMFRESDVEAFIESAFA